MASVGRGWLKSSQKENYNMFSFGRSRGGQTFKKQNKFANTKTLLYFSN